MARPARKPDATVVTQLLNAARYALGHRGRPLSKIPLGEPLTNYSCPLAIALGGTHPVDGNHVYLNGVEAQKVADAWSQKGYRYDNPDRDVPVTQQLWAVPLPEELQRFSKAFDQGKLPEYTATPKVGNGA